MSADAADQEAGRILNLAGGDALTALRIVEAQLNTLQARAQVLASLAGVVVTVTGFSGRAIANVDRLAQLLVVTGLALAVLGAVRAVRGCLRVQWLTADWSDDPRESLTRAILRREQRTHAYTQGGMFLGGGLLLYGAAVARLLLSGG